MGNGNGASEQQQNRQWQRGAGLGAANRVWAAAAGGQLFESKCDSWVMFALLEWVVDAQVRMSHYVEDWALQKDPGMAPFWASLNFPHWQHC